jgi:N-acetylneuraminic acid mutarotase
MAAPLLILAVILLAASSSRMTSTTSPAPTFAERVRALETIERIAYAHQIGATLPFEQAVPRARLESKVRESLERSQALERGGASITTEALEHEYARIRRSSRLPERLAELEAALGGDHRLVLEMLVRPILEARGAGPVTSPVTGAVPACAPDDTWDNGVLDDFPVPRWGHHAFWTGSLMLVWGGQDPPSGGSGARYDPATDSWSPISGAGAPSSRINSAAVWTGSEMIVWGGALFNGPLLSDGARYDPGSDTWRPMTTDTAPIGLMSQTAVWTGREMIVWGVRSGAAAGAGGYGAAYDPASDSWRLLGTVGGPSYRTGHSAVWTGRQMIVWGGQDSRIYPAINLSDGGRYDPAADSWSPLAGAGAPAARSFHTAVWTGREMIVWGGSSGSFTDANSGGRYDPVADAWSPTTTVGAPDPRAGQTAIWTGSEMIVWGGLDNCCLDFTPVFGDGGRYDPVQDAWSPIPNAANVSARADHSAIWTGSEMIVWGGHGSAGFSGSVTSFQSGGRYAPGTGSWTATSLGPAPDGGQGHTAIWTGNVLVIYGGGSLGARYDPMLDAWSPISGVNAPDKLIRSGHSAVWTGNEMIVWGGSGNLNSGGRYDPIADTWVRTSLNGAPAGRRNHVAVWTGRAMLVWGGEQSGNVLQVLGDGGRYDPATDSWTPLSLAGAPSARTGHTGIWTGSLMVVWGGQAASGSPPQLATGGRYDPATDTWTPTAAPPIVARTNHAAAWTGSEMFVWGGFGPFNQAPRDGALYDPVRDTWRNVTQAGAPTTFNLVRSVWTGHEVVVWGTPTEGGARYDPVSDHWTVMSSNGAPPATTFLYSVTWADGLVIVYGSRSGGRYVVRHDVDADGDGFTVCGGDCNDADPNIHPGAAELCDGVDQNCDGSIDEGFGVGSACVEQVDACHEVSGLLACDASGAGTHCAGVTQPHDTSPPVITCPAPAQIECTAAPGGWGAATAVDDCDPVPVVGSDATGPLPPGTHVVTWTATDASGHGASCTQAVTVVDSLPPSLSLHAAPSVLWPPNHRMVPVSVSAVASDACDGAFGGAPTVTLVSATSSEPGLDDIQGATTGTGDFSIGLRAERDAHGTGRTYRLSYVATDTAGHTKEASVVVSVPLSRGSALDHLVPRPEKVPR